MEGLYKVEAFCLPSTFRLNVIPHLAAIPPVGPHTKSETRSKLVYASAIYLTSRADHQLQLLCMQEQRRRNHFPWQ